MWFHREMNSIFYVEADIKPAKIKDDGTTVKKIKEKGYKFLFCRLCNVSPLLPNKRDNGQIIRGTKNGKNRSGERRGGGGGEAQSLSSISSYREWPGAVHRIERVRYGRPRLCRVNFS
ncbi:uncharacterized protein LOC102678711 isoform X2 [Apis dorsata]|uniref:uncharacterized protein LOC102678711 isoform X2 n=1 Tax=Apis dorsata TaxID=7462 RepID=UPI001292E5A2|nr:uncharacterized protein LOC102678711 isoform X2 [Apis dorsata]